MRIALAQINPTVGDLYGNSHKIVDFAREAAKRGADLVVFPEMCVIGYPPLDLLENRTLIRAVSSTVDWIARNVPGNMGVIVGAPVPNDDPVGRRLFNAAILLEGGKQVAVVKKSLLPTYDVFDRSEEHTSELQSRENLVCRLLLEKKNNTYLIGVSFFGRGDMIHHAERHQTLIFIVSTYECV